MDVSALILILNTKVRHRNFVFYDVEVVLACEPDSFVGQFLIRVDLRELPVQLPFEFVVEDNPTNIAADAVNFFGDFVVEPVKVSIMAGLLCLDEPVIKRLLVWE